MHRAPLLYFTHHFLPICSKFSHPHSLILYLIMPHCFSRTRSLRSHSPRPTQSKIRKRSWVLHECVERVPENVDAAKELLQYGLKGTDLEALIAIGNREDGGRSAHGRAQTHNCNPCTCINSNLHQCLTSVSRGLILPTSLFLCMFIFSYV